MWWCATLVAFLLQSGGGAPPNWQAEGLKALESKDYPAAVEALSKAVAAAPTDYAVRFNLALAYSLEGKDSEAIAEYRKTLELKPGLYQANLNLGILLLRNHDPEGALIPLREARQSKPREARPALYLGDAFIAKKQFPEAAEAYAAALQSDPKSAPAELGLARARMLSGQLKEAAEHFERATSLNPEYRTSVLELAETYERQNQGADALAIYSQFPEIPGAQERAGELLLAAGKAQEAIPHLESAVSKSPTSANRLILATAYFKEKQNEKGLAIVAQALSADPKNYDLRMAAGRALRDMKKFPEAASQFLQASQLKPDAVAPWGELATVSVLTENYQQALTAIDKVKALGGEKTPHLYLRAIILDKIRDLKPALAYYQQFLAAAHGEYPEEEFKARQRARIIQRELSKR